MPKMEGIITIVQEGRFQVTDDQGISHLFILGYSSSTEPEQLMPLQRLQSRVRVTYTQPRNIIGMQAKTVEVSDFY